MELFTPLHREAASGLATAPAASSRAPLLLLDDALIALGASVFFCEAFAVDPKTIRGKALDELVVGERGSRQLNSLLLATGLLG